MRVSLVFFLFLQFAQAEKVQVVKVVDGDTIRIKYHYQNQLVRLIGIDTPERRENERAYQMVERSKHSLKQILDLGERSAKFLESKIKPGDFVELEFDVERYDRYGRLLAYIYLSDHSLINSLLLEQGYAYLLTVPPNIKYLEKLKAASRLGRELSRGLWSFTAFRDGASTNRYKKH